MLQPLFLQTKNRFPGGGVIPCVMTQMPQQEESPLLAFRKASRLSQNQLSIHSGLDRFTISRWEQGIVPRLDLVERFARAYDLDVNEWREANGFPRVTETDPARAGEAFVQAVEAQPAQDEDEEFANLKILGWEGDDIPPNDLRLLREAARALRRVRERQGRHRD